MIVWIIVVSDKLSIIDARVFTTEMLADAFCFIHNIEHQHGFRLLKYSRILEDT